jgi:hypothetical protein
MILPEMRMGRWGEREIGRSGDQETRKRKNGGSMML